ncbi:MAG: ATP-dependent Clp protease ATP-binding subunit, partial [Lachnospiraceae bacterium]|nr:ATP-dependent Clp protease ATP-binding subunit [Lachnospiraceae bacterium]
DGHITDAKGRKVSFKNTILIMTSNVGAQRIVAPKNLGFIQDNSAAKDYERMKEGVMEEVKRIFKPEFINRIDEIMVFHQLSNDEMMQIVTLLASNFAKRCKAQLNIDLSMSLPVKKHLVDKYADEKMGARPLKRAMQSVVEDAMAEALLKGGIARDDKVEVVLKDNEIAFVRKNDTAARKTGKRQAAAKTDKKPAARGAKAAKKSTATGRRKAVRA